MREVNLVPREHKNGCDVAVLKQNWMLDPSFDLEATPGFEEYAVELKLFRLEKQLEWANAKLQKYREFTKALREMVSGIKDEYHVNRRQLQ